MLNFVRAAVVALCSVAGVASAGSFDDVLMGESLSELEFSELPSPSSDQAAFSADYIWTNHPQFKNQASAPIVLQACFYRDQVSSAMTGSIVDMRVLSQAAWRTATSKVMDAAREWTAQQMVLNNSLFVSRMSVNFLDAGGQPRVCQPDDVSSHIRILFNSDQTYRSTIGFLRAQNPGWTMTIGASQSGFIPWPQTLHELGHAFGFIHEMGHPSWKPCLGFIDYEAIWWPGMFGSGHTKADEIAILQANVAKAEEGYGKILSTKAPDPTSIMTYPIPAAAFRGHPECAFPENDDLSTRDISTFLSIYGARDLSKSGVFDRARPEVDRTSGSTLPIFAP